MADLATARAPQERDFADRKRREVVVEHEALPGLAFEALDLLGIFGGAERTGDQRLRLAAGEDGGAVRTGEDAGLDPDGPYLIEGTTIETHPMLQDLVAQHFFLEVLEDLLRFDLALDFAFGQCRDQLFENLI